MKTVLMPMTMVMGYQTLRMNSQEMDQNGMILTEIVLEIIKILMMITMELTTPLNLQMVMKTSTRMEFQIILIMTLIMMDVPMLLKQGS